MVDGIRVKNVFLDMESTGCIDAHQCQRVAEDLIFSSSQESNRTISEASINRRTDLDLLPTNQHSPAEGQTETTESNSDYFSMEISDKVPRFEEKINFPTASSLGNNNNSRSQKRKIAVNREQALESDGLADQRRALQEQGFSDLAIDIVVSNELSIKHDFKTAISQGKLNLAIEAPTDKRKGRPITRPCQISRHTDKTLS
ncbi:hypothetical protein AYI69_g2727 [Smittium culicis]|uniref:Uncharacterized protein n=1 Tax=Smittium culicis TaxID=133412 RepID=A0A1R1YLN0_9FUNG|nr:hypothetical protein AYI69_g2727 [Smittium culicis]